MRIDKALRYGPDRDRFTITLPSGGTPTAITLPAGQMDMTATEIAATLAGLLSAVDAGFDVGLDDDNVYIRHGTAFDLSFAARPSLAAALGADSSYTSQTLVKFAGALVYRPALAWDSSLVIRRHHKARRASRSNALALYLGKGYSYSITAPVQAAEIESFRDMMSHLTKGLPVTWFRSDAGSGAWSFANYDGLFECVLAPGSLSWAEQYESGPRQLYMSATFELVGLA